MMSSLLSSHVTRAQKPIYNLNSTKIKRKLENKSRYHNPLTPLPRPQRTNQARDAGGPDGGNRHLRRVGGACGEGGQKLEDGGMVRSVGLVARGYMFLFWDGD